MITILKRLKESKKKKCVQRKRTSKNIWATDLEAQTELKTGGAAQKNVGLREARSILLILL